MRFPIAMVVVLASISIVSCNSKNQDKYTQAPCIGKLCLGSLEENFDLYDCEIGRSPAPSIELKSCRLSKASELTGVMPRVATIRFLNSYAYQAQLEFPHNDCEGVRAIVEAQLGLTKSKYFFPDSVAQKDRQLTDLKKAYEWQTKNGRVLISDLQYSSSDQLCYLQLDANWVDSELESSVKAQAEVKG